MAEEQNDHRKFKRYNTEIDVYFDFAYDLETKIEFKLLAKEKERTRSYQGVSKNISAEGLCFVTHKDVKPGELLDLELYLPNSNRPIPMKGEVRWDKIAPAGYEQHGLKENHDEKIYMVGVQLISVFNEAVKDSVYYDKEYEVNWSAVLESVFGNYKMLMGEKFKKKKKQTPPE